MKWYLKALKQYATFSGRASRKEFWMFVLFDIIFSIVLWIFDDRLGGIPIIEIPIEIPDSGYYYNLSYGIFTTVYAVVLFIPRWAVTVRRMHDIGLSGWWIIIFIFIALIGGTLGTMGGTIIALISDIVFLILMISPGDSHTNKYGKGVHPTTNPTPFHSTERKLSDPKMGKEYFEQGNDAANIGNFKNAIGCYKKALDILGTENNSLTAALHFNMGRAYYDMGEYDKALECFSTAQLADPASVEPHYEIGRIMQETGEPDGAIEAYELVIHREPDYVDAHSNLGIIYLQQGKMDQAIACFQKAAQLGDESAQQWLKENGHNW